MSTFISGVSRVLIALGASYTSLQLVVISLKLSEFLLMASLNLCNTGLELLESVLVCHGCWKKVGDV